MSRCVGLLTVLLALSPPLTVARAATASLPPGVFAGEPSAAAAEAGAYTIDATHTSVIAKVSHIGYALSVFRFDEVDGTLQWDPAKPAQSSLTAAVKTAFIATPVPGFAKELAGEAYLNTAAFPTITFVSTAFHRTDALHGRVEGTMSLLGKSRPVTLEVTLQGAGKGIMGHPRIGVQATGRIDPQAFGMNPMFAAPIRIEIDAEFQKS